MHTQAPIGLSDEALTLIMRLTAPLVPDGRVAFVDDLAALLRSEPQPPGDGAVYRHARELLRSGRYKRSDLYAIGVGNAAPRHEGRNNP
jgi:hypothetical protein